MLIFKKIIIYYFFICGLLINSAILGLIILKPSLFYKVAYQLQNTILVIINTGTPNNNTKYNLNSEIHKNFKPWRPLDNQSFHTPKKIKIGTSVYNSLKEASSALRDGDTMLIGPGIYHQGMIIKANNIKIIGQEHVIFDAAVIEGKGAIITKGDNILIKNIECRHIKVHDKNGACIRAEGKDLYVEHVYFHDSEQGILSGNTELIHIKDSRFEKLGKNGRAHGIYVGNGQLIIENSLFLAALSEGHEIKSRGYSTIIKNSVIASLSSNDSRLIDISNGGELLIDNSILQQGPNSVNNDVIGFALEKNHYKKGKIIITNSIIILEREKGNNLLHINPKVYPFIKVSKNLVITPNKFNISGFNTVFKNRKQAGLNPYPFIPTLKQQ